MSHLHNFTSTWVSLSPTSSESRISCSDLLPRTLYYDLNLFSGHERTKINFEASKNDCHHITNNSTHESENSGEDEKNEKNIPGKPQFSRRNFETAENAVDDTEPSDSEQKFHFAPVSSSENAKTFDTESKPKVLSVSEADSVNTVDICPTHSVASARNSIFSEALSKNSQTFTRTTSWGRELKNVFSISGSLRELAGELLLAGLFDISDVHRWAEEQASLNDKPMLITYASTKKSKFLRAVAKRLWVALKLFCHLRRQKTQHSKWMTGDNKEKAFHRPPPEYVASSGRFNISGSSSPHSISPIPRGYFPFVPSPRLSATSSITVHGSTVGGIIGSNVPSPTASEFENNLFTRRQDSVSSGPQIQVNRSLEGMIEGLNGFSPLRPPSISKADKPASLQRATSIALSYLSFLSTKESNKDAGANKAQLLPIPANAPKCAAAEIFQENPLSPCYPSSSSRFDSKNPAIPQTITSPDNMESLSEEWYMGRILMAFSEEEKRGSNLSQKIEDNTFSTFFTKEDYLISVSADFATVESSASSIVEDTDSLLPSPDLRIKKEPSLTETDQESVIASNFPLPLERLESWQVPNSETLRFSEYERNYLSIRNAVNDTSPVQIHENWQFDGISFEASPRTTSGHILNPTMHSQESGTVPELSAPESHNFNLVHSNTEMIYKSYTAVEFDRVLSERTDEVILSSLLTSTDTDESAEIDEIMKDCRQEIFRASALWKETREFLLEYDETWSALSSAYSESSTNTKGVHPSASDSNSRSVLNGSEIELKYIVERRNQSDTDSVIAIINNYRRVFPHLTRTVVEPCNDTIRALVEAVLSIADTEYKIFVQGEDLCREALANTEVIGSNKLSESGNYARKMDYCYMLLSQIQQQITFLHEKLAILKTGFESEIFRIKGMVIRIAKVRQRILKHYDAFYKEISSKGTIESQDIDVLTKANEYRNKTVWYTHVNFDVFEKLLVNDMSALIATEEALTVMVGRIRDMLEKHNVSISSHENDHCGNSKHFENTGKSSLDTVEETSDESESDTIQHNRHFHIFKGKGSKQNPIKYPRPPWR